MSFATCPKKRQFRIHNFGVFIFCRVQRVIIEKLMSLGVDPVISNLFFSLNLVHHFGKVDKTQKHNIDEKSPTDLPFVSVIVALYKEKPEDIDITVSSLQAQSYPKDRYEILFVVEPDDKTTIDSVNLWIERLQRSDITAKVISSDGKVHTKPYALNQAIDQAAGEYCVFYDASDTIDRDQVEKGISVMVNGNYDVAQAKVLRKGNALLDRFLLLDTIIWYWKYVPMILRFAGGFPLSGEGLFVKTAVLHETQKFPEVLTEDAFLGMTLTEKNKRFTLLDSIVIEKTPKNVKAHFKQKLRWHRGYLTCLRRLFFTNMPWYKKFFFFLPFAIPISAALAFWGWSLIILSIIVRVLGGYFQTNILLIESTLYTNVLYYWSFFLLYLGIPLSIFSSIHAMWCTKMLGYAAITVLLPLYWVFVGFCSICSFFRGTSDWGKTDR